MRISDWSSDVCSSDLIAREPCFGDFAIGRPARRPIGRDMARLTCAPERSRDRTRASKEAARGGDRPRSVENLGRIGLEMIPPGEERPWLVDGRVEQSEPGRTEFRLIDERRGAILSRAPDAEDHDQEDDEYLAEQQPDRKSTRLNSSH